MWLECSDQGGQREGSDQAGPHRPWSGDRFHSTDGNTITEVSYGTHFIMEVSAIMGLLCTSKAGCILKNELDRDKQESGGNSWAEV